MTVNPADPHAPQAHPSDDPLRFLRAHTTGLLTFDELTLPLSFILDPATTDPVAPIPAAVLAAEHLVLQIPDESDHALQLLVIATELQPDIEACDRWRIYHGPPREARFARLEIQSARLGAAIFDGDDLRGPNPLHAIEPRLCTFLNADPSALAALCRRITNVTPADPRAVGVDPAGLDIRARFGTIRLELDPPITNPSDAEPRLRQLLHPDLPT